MDCNSIKAKGDVAAMVGKMETAQREATSRTATFEFMNLPPEIRIMIYRLALDFNSCTFPPPNIEQHLTDTSLVYAVLRRLYTHKLSRTDYLRPRDYRSIARESVNITTPGLLLTNKLIHTEAMAELKKSPLIFNNSILRMCSSTGIAFPDLFPAAAHRNVDYLHMSTYSTSDLRLCTEGFLWYAGEHSKLKKISFESTRTLPVVIDLTDPTIREMLISCIMRSRAVISTANVFELIPEFMTILGKHGKPCPSYKPADEEIDKNDLLSAEEVRLVRREREVFAKMDDNAKWGRLIKKEIENVAGGGGKTSEVEVTNAESSDGYEEVDDDESFEEE